MQEEVENRTLTLVSYLVFPLTTCLPTDSQNRPTRDGIPDGPVSFVSAGLSVSAFSGFEGSHSIPCPDAGYIFQHIYFSASFIFLAA